MKLTVTSSNFAQLPPGKAITLQNNGHELRVWGLEARAVPLVLEKYDVEFHSDDAATHFTVRGYADLAGNIIRVRFDAE